jgi:hypothetical protein
MTAIQKEKMIKLIHAQKTRAGLDDDTYRVILTEAADVKSSLDMRTMEQFNAVITALNNLLIAQGKTPMGGSVQPIPRDVFPLVKRAERVLGENAKTRLEGFVYKLGKNSVNELSPWEIRKCHAFLTRLEQQGGR